MIEIREDALKQHDCLVVAFAGLGHALGGIPYEFHRTLSGVDCAALYVRDLGRRWYQYGPGDGDSDPRQVIKRIRQAKKHCGARRLVFLGNSMGGFGALMYAALMPQADAVLAFSPQTVILPGHDERWLSYWQEIPNPRYGDLAALPRPKADVLLIYDEFNPLERKHIRHLLQTWPRCHVRMSPGNHDVAASLLASGELAPLIARAIASEPRLPLLQRLQRWWDFR